MKMKDFLEGSQFIYLIYCSTDWSQFYDQALYTTKYSD